MKKYFYIALVIILMLSVGIIVWGTYLNSRGENIIAARMDNRKLPLKGQTVQYREIQPMLTLDTMKLAYTEMTDAVALIDGRIVSANVKRNTNVKAGDVMFTLVNDEVPLKIKQADSAILKAQASLKRAQNDYNRYRSLMDMDATSAIKFDESEANYRAAEADVEAAEAAKQQLVVQGDRQVVTAPVDGEVLLMYRQTGSYVQMGTSLALVGDFSHLTFTQDMSDVQIRKLAQGDTLTMELQPAEMEKIYGTEYAAGNQGAAQSFFVKISGITPDLSQEASIRQVVFDVGNPARILEPQTYHNVHLISSAVVHCLTVPLSAMLSQENNRVYVVDAEGLLQRRDVVTGVRDNDYIEIISGLSEGDIVITADTNGLEEGTPVNVELEGE